MVRQHGVPRIIEESQASPPLLLLVRAAKTDKRRIVSPPRHSGQGAGASAWAIGRMASKRFSQLLHLYS